jgi:uncharacterized protein (TIGR00369 family)
MSESTEPFQRAAIARLLGFRIAPGKYGECEISFDAGEAHHNPMGRVHGGVLSALADAAMGIAFARTLDPGQDFSTIELHVRFVRPLRAATLTARASVIQRGLRTGFVECRIEDQRQRLIALADCTCTVIIDN